MTACMAFAGAVYTLKKKLEDCPHIPAEILEEYNHQSPTPPAAVDLFDNAMATMKEQIAAIDLRKTAEGIGGNYKNGKLTIQVLGKNYSVDDHGNVSTDIHVIPWVALPVYSYILMGEKKEPSGTWVPLRELPSGKDWYRLFGQRCEKPLKKVADRYPDLFEDMVRLFNGRQVKNHYSSDVSLVLHPLPKLPMLICYWRPEHKLDSDLNLFFDATAEENLDLNSINTLGSGFVSMLEKLTLHHGWKAQ